MTALRSAAVAVGAAAQAGCTEAAPALVAIVAVPFLAVAAVLGIRALVRTGREIDRVLAAEEDAAWVEPAEVDGPDYHYPRFAGRRDPLASSSAPDPLAARPSWAHPGGLYRSPSARPRPCAAAGHAGPFTPRSDLSGWLGLQWFQCEACQSTVSAQTVRDCRAPGVALPSHAGAAS